MYCHGASELEHNRFTQYNLIVEERKILHVQAASYFLPDKGILFYFGGFVIPNKVERDLVYVFTEVFRGIHDAANKDKFWKC